MNQAETLGSLILRGYLRSPRVIQAMKAIPREGFLPAGMRAYAWEDHPLPIGYSQTISAPHMYAFMLEAAQIRKGDKILEIGTGSGYGAALLSFLTGKTGKVFSIELLPKLAEFAEGNIARAGQKAKIIVGDGAHGFAKCAPYDRILVTAACEEMPIALVSQLKNGGLLLAPVGTYFQELMLAEKTSLGTKITPLLPVRFVPLLAPKKG